MTYPTVLTVIFASFLCSTAADKGLHLKGYSEGGVEGCYEHSQELAVCFDVKKDSMLIKKASGEGIVHYQELGPDMFLYQVLDDAFVGRGSAIFYVPDDVPKTPEALRSFLRDISDDETSEHETLKNHYQAAMSELHYVPEIQLLELVSAALADNSTRLELLQPFHAMCFNLFKATGVKVKDEFRAAHDMGDETADQHYREKRCSRPKANTCRGMCGLGCWCWSWFCGDCCLHRGCYEHDICCNYGRLTSYCATPFRYGFTCSKFGGYPRCKKRKSWWG